MSTDGLCNDGYDGQADSESEGRDRGRQDSRSLGLAAEVAQIKEHKQENVLRKGNQQKNRSRRAKKNVSDIAGRAGARNTNAPLTKVHV